MTADTQAAVERAAARLRQRRPDWPEARVQWEAKKEVQGNG